MKKLLVALVLLLPTELYAEEYNWRVFACDVKIPPAYIEQYPDERYQLRFNLWIDVNKSAAHIGDFAHYNNHRLDPAGVHILELEIDIFANYIEAPNFSWFTLEIDRTRIEGNTKYEYHYYDIISEEWKVPLYRGTCKPDHKWTTKF